jgi:hypothetical protein
MLRAQAIQGKEHIPARIALLENQGDNTESPVIQEILRDHPHPGVGSGKLPAAKGGAHLTGVKGQAGLPSQRTRVTRDPENIPHLTQTGKNAAHIPVQTVPTGPPSLRTRKITGESGNLAQPVLTGTIGVRSVGASALAGLPFQKTNPNGDPGNIPQLTQRGKNVARIPAQTVPTGPLTQRTGMKARIHGNLHPPEGTVIENLHRDPWLHGGAGKANPHQKAISLPIPVLKGNSAVIALAGLGMNLQEKLDRAIPAMEGPVLPVPEKAFNLPVEQSA